MNFSNIKNIIFDLGNVVIDIDPSKTYQSFANLSKSKNAIEVEQLIKEKHIWLDYEKGFNTEGEFRETLTQALDLQATYTQIDQAFNALLLDIDPRRIDLIERLGKSFRLFVLSNTSKIHMDEFEKIAHRCTGRPNIWSLFEKPYFSFEMGKLKPELEIYQEVLDSSNLLPEQTLFIDDLLPNIEGAKLLHINTIHLVKPFTIVDHLYEI
ncbi:MAG: HAD family phosphatase [Bacteroidota bacterium]